MGRLRYPLPLGQRRQGATMKLDPMFAAVLVSERRILDEWRPRAAPRAPRARRSRDTWARMAGTTNESRPTCGVAAPCTSWILTAARSCSTTELRAARRRARARDRSRRTRSGGRASGDRATERARSTAGAPQGSQAMTPILMCLRCGYVQKDKGRSNRDRAHAERCDFSMWIRYRDEHGRIHGGYRGLRGWGTR